MDIQATDLDQVGVHRRVEEAVVGHIVHMAIHIVVVPASNDRLEVPVVGALGHAVSHEVSRAKGLAV
ncbi:hypothetical protein D3C81_1802940 [compost metagenome]